MKQELKDKWTEALTSGQYNQGTGTLRNKRNEFCCLGVLCDIVNPNDWIDPPPGTDRYALSDGTNAYLPEPFRAEYGISEQEMIDLAQMNDSGTSFAEIAKYVERQLKENP